MAGKKSAKTRGEQPAKRLKLEAASGSSLTGLVEEEEAFPRGSGGQLSALERRSIRHQATQDALFGEGEEEEEEEEGGAPRRRKKRPPAVQSSSVQAAGRGAGKRFETLSQKKLRPGLLVLGAVLEVHQYEVIFSLPFNMRGSVAISDVSPVLTRQLQSAADDMPDTLNSDSDEAEGGSIPKLEKLFAVGALMPCYVTAVSGSRISVSVSPDLINAHLQPRDIKPGWVVCGCVRSVEDHGYIIDFGVEGKTGFLLKKQAAEFVKTHQKGRPLSLGQVLQCLVLPGADARSVPVGISPGGVAGAVTTADSLPTLNSLVPGMLVNATVKELGANGLLMGFLGGFEGVVSLRHLPLPSQHSVSEGFPLRKKLRARLLWVDVGGKSLGLSLQKQVVSGTAYSFENVEIGDVFQAAKVFHVDHASSLYLELTSDVCGYAPTWLVSDERNQTSGGGKEVRKGSHHVCRVVQFNLIDGVAIVSLQASVLAKPFLGYAGVRSAEVLQGVVERVGSFGAVVSLTGNVRGLCPTIHLSDARLRQPRKVVKEGLKVKCRVLSVEPDRRRLLLTCKKSFVRSTRDPLLSYEQATPGSIFQGVITSVHNYGVIVHFYNHVHGLVMRSKLGGVAHLAGSELSSVFWPGQPVEARVLECSPAEGKLLLSLRPEEEEEREDCEVGSLAGGTMVSHAEVTGIASNGISVRCGSSSSSQQAFLPTLHLSDFPQFCQGLLSLHQHKLERSLKKGREYALSELLVLSAGRNFSPPLLTRKPTLVSHFQEESNIVSSVADIKPSQILPGFIKKLMPYGCFVEFTNGVSGLVPNKYLTDEFQSSAAAVYQESQTVWVRVMEADEGSGRLLLSLRPADLLEDSLYKHGIETRLLSRFDSYVSEMDSVLKQLPSLAEIYELGRCVSGHVTSVQRDHVIVELENGVTGKAARHHQTAGVEVGVEVQCCMLAMDVLEETVELSLDPRLLSQATAAICGDGLASFSSPLALTVEHVSSYHLLCSHQTKAGLKLLYAVLNTGQLGVLPTSLQRLRLGDTVSGTLLRDARDDQPAVAMVIDGAMATSRSRRKPFGIKEGDIISAVVQSVKPSQLSVSSGVARGRVHCTLARDAPEPGKGVFPGIQPGDTLQARVVRIKELPSRWQAGRKVKMLELATMESLLLLDGGSQELFAHQLLRKSYTPGETLTGVISHVDRKGLHVSLSPRAEGFAPLIMVSNDLAVLRHPSRHFKVGEAVQVTVVERGGKSPHQLSLTGAPPTPDVGEVVIGHFKETLAAHAFLVTTPLGIGRMDITDVSDHYQPDPIHAARTSKFFKCCVVQVEGGKLDLSLRASRTGHQLGASEGSGDTERGSGDTTERGSGDPEIASLEEVEEGAVVRGYIKSVTNVGVFVRLGRGIDGRVKITHLTDGFVKNFKKHFPPGKLVTAKVLKVETNGRIELSLRLSLVDPAAARRLRKTRPHPLAGSKKKKRRKASSTSDGDSIESSDEDSGENNTGEVCSSSSEEEEEEEEEGEEGEGERRPALSFSAGFQWEEAGGVASRDTEDSDEEEEDQVASSSSSSSKKTRRQKAALKKSEEAEIASVERSHLDGDRLPESAEDFDRLLLSSPASSQLWVRYMAFHLHATEVDRARAVAERALKTIPFREEGEKLNVWGAWLNLENLYGSQPTLLRVFHSALQECDPLKVFMRLASVYTESDKLDLAEQLYLTMSKKFGSSVRVWVEFGEFLMRKGKHAMARSQLQWSLKKLPTKQDHVSVISSFARLEYRHGDPERGATMFEQLLTSYPKRVDLWTVYVDMATKAGDLAKARGILERAIQLKLSARKMKALFKRYLQLEMDHGTPACVEGVRAKARAYVEAKTAVDTA